MIITVIHIMYILNSGSIFRLFNLEYYVFALMLRCEKTQLKYSTCVSSLLSITMSKHMIYLGLEREKKTPRRKRKTYLYWSRIPREAGKRWSESGTIGRTETYGEIGLYSGGGEGEDCGKE